MAHDVVYRKQHVYNVNPESLCGIRQKDIVQADERVHVITYRTLFILFALAFGGLFWYHYSFNIAPACKQRFPYCIDVGEK